MNFKAKQSVTADQAVAQIVNVDYIPEGFTLLEMTAAFLEEAEVDYRNAGIEQKSDDQKSLLAMRANICEARHQLAQQLLESLQLELENKDGAIVQGGQEKEPRFDMLNVADWAFYQFGIGTPTGIDFGKKQADFSWEDVAIKIYADYKLGVKIKNGRYSKSSFQSIGLMGKRHLSIPNKLGGILLGLCQGHKYPLGKLVEPRHKTAISKLRRSLAKLVQLSEDPFLPYNEGDGWRPRFALIDDRRNADERAKDEAVLVPFDESRDSETPDFDQENDDAGRYIRAEEYKKFTGNPSD